MTLNVTGLPSRMLRKSFASHLDRLKHGSDTEPGPAFHHSAQSQQQALCLDRSAYSVIRMDQFHVPLVIIELHNVQQKFTLPEAWVKIERIAEKRGDTSLCER